MYKPRVALQHRTSRRKMHDQEERVPVDGTNSKEKQRPTNGAGSHVARHALFVMRDEQNFPKKTPPPSILTRKTGIFGEGKPCGQVTQVTQWELRSKN